MPYTSHGHAYGVVDVGQPRPSAVARCGGPGLCQKCAREAAEGASSEAAASLPRVERDKDGRPVWIHYCTDGDPDFDGEIRLTLRLGPTGWEWTDDGGLTPSILCHSCQTHGFWMGGAEPHFRRC